MADRQDTFYIKQGNLLPALATTLTDEDGNAVDYSGYTGLRFHMRLPGATSAKVDAAATEVNAAVGTITYAWTGTDTDTPGVYQAEFEVTMPTGKPITYPNDGYIDVIILPKLA